MAGWRSGLVVVGFLVWVLVVLAGWSVGFLAGWLVGFLVVAFWGFCFGCLAYWSLGNRDRGFGLEALVTLSLFLLITRILE